MYVYFSVTAGTLQIDPDSRQASFVCVCFAFVESSVWSFVTHIFAVELQLFSRIQKSVSEFKIYQTERGESKNKNTRVLERKLEIKWRKLELSAVAEPGFRYNHQRNGQNMLKCEFCVSVLVRSIKQRNMRRTAKPSC